MSEDLYFYTLYIKDLRGIQFKSADFSVRSARSVKRGFAYCSLAMVNNKEMRTVTLAFLTTEHENMKVRLVSIRKQCEIKVPNFPFM